MRTSFADSPIATWFGLTVEIPNVVLVATSDHVGSDGKVNIVALTMVLLAASHLAFNESYVSYFTVHPTVKKAEVGDRLVGIAMVKVEYEESANIHAEVRVGDKIVAFAEIFRRKA